MSTAGKREIEGGLRFVIDLSRHCATQTLCRANRSVTNCMHQRVKDCVGEFWTKCAKRSGNAKLRAHAPDAPARTSRHDEAERYADVRITEPGAACGGRGADPYGAIQSFVDVQGRSTKSASKAPAWCTPSTTQSRPGERAPILRSPIRAFPLTVCEYRTPSTAGHSPSAMATVCTVQGAAGDRGGQR